MSEVRVIARIQAREGKAQELKPLLRGLLAPTRAEAGCKYYNLFESQYPGIFYFDEVWESQAHLDKHAQSNHLKSTAAKLKDLVQAPPEVNILKAIE
ncbi:MAG TPA: putative quinol monooxygenase [Candidatus Acidoferrales bacterium]